MRGLLILFLLLAGDTCAQDHQGETRGELTGQWNGKLEVQGISVRLIFHLSWMEGRYIATMDSPDQGANGIPVTTTSFQSPVVKFEIPAGGIVYEGTLIDSTHITGFFSQAGQSFPLNLEKGLVAIQLARPQEPKPPFPYFSEEVSFENTKDKVTLKGTFTRPLNSAGRFPVVILISGSGPQNRDEEILGHKPFLLIADYLTRRGIAVLRFDERGVGKSSGDFSKATSLDFARDVEAAVVYLKTRPDINTKHIGLIGHSEGGIIAPMVAAKSKDVDFIVLMAGPGLPGYQVVLQQQEAIGRASGVAEEELQKLLGINKGAFELMVNTPDPITLRKKLTEYMLIVMKDLPAEGRAEGMSDEDYSKQLVDEIMQPWMYQFLVYDPALALKKVNCPVLAMNGERDLQVLAQPNLDAIKASLDLARNKDLTIIKFSNLNHLFQECVTGLPAEYGQIEQTLSPEMLEKLGEWVEGQVE